MIRTRWVDPEDGESYETLQGVDWPAISLQQAEQALQEIQVAMQPADERSLAALLYELWLATAKQSTATQDQQALSSVYVRELREWPADIALQVLRQAKRSSRWFPPLADLYRECTDLARQRQWLLSSLEVKIEAMKRPALPAPAVLPAVRKMPGSDSPAKSIGFWSVDTGANVEKLARLKGITYRQARAMLVYASPAEMLELEEAVRAQEGQGG